MKRLFAAFCIVSIVSAVALCGCQTAKAPSEEELLSQGIADSIAALKAGDIDKLLSFYSESFSSPQVGDKKGLTDFLESAKGMGYLDNLEVDMSQSKRVITGKTATVGPVSLSGAFGSTSADFSCVREKEGWRVSGMDINM